RPLLIHLASRSSNCNRLIAEYGFYTTQQAPLDIFRLAVRTSASERGLYSSLFLRAVITDPVRLRAVLETVTPIGPGLVLDFYASNPGTTVREYLQPAARRCAVQDPAATLRHLALFRQEPYATDVLRAVAMQEPQRFLTAFNGISNNGA